MVLIPNIAHPLTLQIHPVFHDDFTGEAVLTQSRFKEEQFFLFAKFGNEQKSYDFECSFYFEEGQSQFVITNFTGVYADEENTTEIKNLSDIPDDDEEHMEPSFWTTLNMVLITLFGIGEVFLMW